MIVNVIQNYGFSFQREGLKSSEQLSQQDKRYKVFYGKGTKASACTV
jgi:hypothetical protein